MIQRTRGGVCCTLKTPVDEHTNNLEYCIDIPTFTSKPEWTGCAMEMNKQLVIEIDMVAFVVLFLLLLTDNKNARNDLQ